MNSQGYPNGPLRASDHIRLAKEMLVLLGDAEKIINNPHIVERSQALAEGARAHIDMARFKMDFPHVGSGARRINSATEAVESGEVRP